MVDVCKMHVVARQASQHAACKQHRQAAAAHQHLRLQLRDADVSSPDGLLVALHHAVRLVQAGRVRHGAAAAEGRGAHVQPVLRCG